MKFRSAISIAALAVLFPLTSCIKTPASDDNPLFMKPPENSTVASFQTEQSTVGVMASVPLSKISDLINASMPATYSNSGNGSDVCKGYRIPTPFGDWKDEKCVGTHYSINVSRSASAVLEPVDQQTIRISFPIDVSGQGGFRGTLADMSGLDAKNFRASMRVWADVTPRISEDWCPILDLSVGYSWNDSPKVEIVSGVWVDIKSQVEDAINGQLPQLVSSARNVVECGNFRNRIADSFRTKSVPISGANGQTAYLNIVPKDVGFSGLIVDGGDLKVAATLDADASISTSAIKEEPYVLPKLKTIAPSAPRLVIKLPIRAPYSVIKQAVASQMIGKKFSESTPLGQASVAINDIDVYPSGDKLVVGLHISARAPGKVADTQGVVYVFATPFVANGNKVVLHGIGFSEVLDNDFWKWASVIFEGRIIKELERNSVFDLSSQIAASQNDIAEKLKSVSPGLSAEIVNPKLALGRLVAAKDEVAAEVIYEASINLSSK